MIAPLVVYGVKEFVAGVQDAQKTKLRFMRGELKRGGQRVSKEFIRRDLSGPPGIRGGEFKKGKKVFSFVQAPNDPDMAVFVGISRGLRVHEEGHAFTPKKGDLLYIREDKQRGGDKRSATIVATAHRVVIPARLHFRQTVREMGPPVLQKVAEAGARGVEVAIKKHMENVVRAI